MRQSAQLSLGLGLAAGLVVGCSSSPELESLLQALPPEEAGADQEWHVGPDVHVADTGTARFVQPLHEAFDPERSMKTVEFVDQFYRAPANDGYDQVIDRLEKDLRAAGFGGSDERLQIEVLEEEEPIDAWTPISAELTLLADGEEPHTLHAFDTPEGVDRVMLPVHAPSCDVEGDVALTLDQLKKGMILVTDVSASQVRRRAQARGAAAVVSASLQDFNADPSGQERHFDAIQFRTLDASNATPVAQISLNSLHAIEAAVERAAVRKRPVRLRFRAKVNTEERPVRTLVATIRGAEQPEKAVVMVSHVQEPGASDNASGVAGLLEGARSLAATLKSEKLPWPEASLVFIWGDEFRQSEIWLERTEMLPLAGISSDMTGQKRETGAIALLERMPDPGAIFTLPPDAHTPWGAGEVDSDSLSPNGFAVIARCAMVDVGLFEGGDWPCADHPWEGGSDHDVFIDRGIPAVLFWHFTDFTYHTSLDRIEFVDPQEIRRTTVAIMATALAVADPEPGDLDRYLKTLENEKEIRIAAAQNVEDAGLEALWAMWCTGARNWLRKLCLGIEEDLPEVGDH
jgi:hypothetical protein